MNYKENYREQDAQVETDFDFDDWMALHARDPEAFEARRQAWVDQVIDSAPVEYQRRLRGLMFQVDMERRRSSNPMDACLRISSLMWDKFGDLKSHLNAMANPQQSEQISLRVERGDAAQVLAFSRGAD